MFCPLIGEIGKDLGGIGRAFLVGGVEELGDGLVLFLQQFVLAGELGFVADATIYLRLQLMPFLIEAGIGDRVAQFENAVNNSENDQNRADNNTHFPSRRQGIEPFELFVRDHGKQLCRETAV